MGLKRFTIQKNMEKFIDKMEKRVYYNINRKYNTNMYGK